MGSGGEEASSESVLSDSSFDEQLRRGGRSSFDERRTGSKTAGSSSGVSSDLSDSDNDYKVNISLCVSPSHRIRAHQIPSRSMGQVEANMPIYIILLENNQHPTRRSSTL